MLVKITYSAELQEVPDEVLKIISSVRNESEELFRSLDFSSKEFSSEKDIKASLVKLERSLGLLAKLEAKLKDSHAILNGYLNILESPPDKEEGRELEK